MGLLNYIIAAAFLLTALWLFKLLHVPISDFFALRHRELPNGSQF